MKKVLSLFLTMLIVLIIATTVSAAGEKVYLGDMSFNLADGFAKSSQNGETSYYINTSNSSESLSITYVAGILKEINGKTIADVDEGSLKSLLDGILTEETLSAQMTQRNGFQVTATIGQKTASMKQTNSGIPMYMYEINYTGSAPGKTSYYGHYMVAIFGYFDDMYMFEFDRLQSNTSSDINIVNMFHSITFGETTTTTPSTDAIKIKVNGSYVYPDSEPLIKNNRTIVPIRAVAEKLGYQVSWDGATRTVTIVSGLDTLTIKIGQSYMDLNTKVPGQNYSERARITLDTPAEIINDRTYLPLRAIGEALGCEVDWDGSTRTVIINQK